MSSVVAHIPHRAGVVLDSRCHQSKHWTPDSADTRLPPITALCLRTGYPLGWARTGQQMRSVTVAPTPAAYAITAGCWLTMACSRVLTSGSSETQGGHTCSTAAGRPEAMSQAHLVCRSDRLWLPRAQRSCHLERSILSHRLMWQFYATQGMLA